MSPKVQVIDMEGENQIMYYRILNKFLSNMDFLLFYT